MTILIQLPYGSDWVDASRVAAVTEACNALVVQMDDGTKFIVRCSTVGEARPLRDKFAAELNDALKIMAAPHLRINPEGYATAHSARWHYPAAGELAPPGAIVQLLTVGGTQVQGIWRDSGSYIAWAPNLKRDRTLEAQHGLSTPEGS